MSLEESKQSTWKDEEDSRNKGQDGAMWTNMADVTEHKANEHEEQADRGKGVEERIISKLQRRGGWE